MRTELLNGGLPLPMSHKFEEQLLPQDFLALNRMWTSLWKNYIRNKSSTSGTYWAELFSSAKVYNIVLMSLSKAGWIVSHSIPARNWAELELNENKLLNYVSSSELDSIRANHKLAQYLPDYYESVTSSLTKLNGKYRKTGLVRNGFKASGNTPFMYDLDMLATYQEPITRNVNKGMEKVRELYPNMQSDLASYDSVSSEIVLELLNNPAVYTMGNNVSDSRGRAIKQSLSKVANPIGYKDFRALLVIPSAYRNLATENGAKAIHLFIAELVGFRNGSIIDKEIFGIECYQQRRLHDIDLDTEEGRADLFENIWLERLYYELDAYHSKDEHYWSTPVELDASASMLSHMGALLGDKRLLEMTNTSYTGILNDPWKVDGIPRNMNKPVVMKKTYGSSKSSAELLKDDKIPFTLEQLSRIELEMTQGGYGIANDLKEFIIRFVKPSEKMSITVYEDTFDIECNRYRNVGERTTAYDIYDTQDDVIKRIHHTTTKRVADLDQFKRWFVTGLIHSQDSQVADFTMEKVISKFQWGLDIHDAFIVCPEAASFTRRVYADEMQVIYDNRHNILSAYFKSINIGAEAQAEWQALMSKVVPIENFKASEWALK